ncbi:hypothetical protein TH53_00270 [Pedobacter lusitanus]|uniref:Uncharacterized protein n=1 Tax=Pedobacter lusitanus TaxID=1503925 RepID=A0A0D0G2F6_9SPHI|nr:hypothetical protein [Pedobacter lusitanus]KIO78964.1 hypothetical protein TH53_00270 [Pedobacter lusitanus]
MKEANELFKNPTPFKKNFVDLDIEESYFFIQTGIQCSHTNIKKYVDLKARLGDNWTWKKISIADPYLNRENDSIEVNLGKFTKMRL